MAGFQIEDGVCTGRGFSGIDANGICAKFKEWVVKTYANGGPNWYIIDDFSAVVFKNFAPTDIALATENINIAGHGFAGGMTVSFSTTGTAPTGLTNNTTYYVIYVDANNIKLATSFDYAVAGAAIDITAQGSGVHTITPLEYFIIVCDTNTPVLNAYNSGPSGNAPKFIRFGYIVANAGYININGFLWWDTTAKKGRGYWTGRQLLTYDAADFVYSFRGGAEQMCVMTRTGATWNHMIIDDWVGDPNLVEAHTKVGVLQSGVSVGSNVVLQLDTGEALNFTANKYYYIFDFASETKIEYVKVTAVDILTDQVTIERCYQGYTSGAVIHPYAHRVCSRGTSRSTNGYQSTIIFIDETHSNSGNIMTRIPYHSVPNSMTGCYAEQKSARNNFCCRADFLDQVIMNMAPADDGFYAAQRPVIVEYTTPATISNRAYGIHKNIYASAPGTMLAFSDYRIINARQWLYIGSNDFHTLILNTESLT